MISSYVVDLLGFNERMATRSIIFTSGAVLLQTAVPFYLLANKIHSSQPHIGSASGYKLTTIVSCFTNEANDTAKSQVRHKKLSCLEMAINLTIISLAASEIWFSTFLWMQLIAITMHQVLIGHCTNGDVRTLTRN